MFGEKTLYSSNITGTAAYTLDAAVGSFKSWRSQFADGAVAFYLAENGDGTIWELGYGAVTYGSPDTIARTLIASSTSSLISWVAADAPIYVYSAPTAAALNHLIKGGLGTSRPAWMRAGGGWLDYTLGLAVTWVKNRWNGSADMEEGRFDVAKGIFVASPRRPWTATGTSGKTIAAADVGGVFTMDNAAASRVFQLPALSAVDHGFLAGGLGLTGAGGYGIVVTPNGTDTIEGGGAGVARTVPGGVRFDVVRDAATGTWRLIYLNTPPAPATGRRQTVAGGPVTSTGLPNFLPASASGLTLTTQNVGVTAPLVITAAGGFGIFGAVDRVAALVANFSWTLADASSLYLFVDIDTLGNVTPGSTTTAPAYQPGGTYSTTSGAFTFNQVEMVGKLGNGSTAAQVWRVFVGEAVTSGGNISSTVAYAYNGRYESAFTATLPAAATATPANHNLGVMPGRVRWIAECTSTDLGYAVGEQIDDTNNAGNNGTFSTAVAISRTKTALSYNTSGNPYGVLHKTTGAYTALDPTKWKYKFLADRDW